MSNRRNFAVALSVIAGLVLAVVVVIGWFDADDATETAAASPPLTAATPVSGTAAPLTTTVPLAPREIASRFMDALNAWDAVALLELIAADAAVSDQPNVTTADDYAAALEFFRAMQWEWTIDGCTESISGPSTTMTCPYEAENAWSTLLVVPPFAGTYELVVVDGEIVEVRHDFDDAAFDDAMGRRLRQEVQGDDQEWSHVSTMFRSLGGIDSFASTPDATMLWTRLTDEALAAAPAGLLKTVVDPAEVGIDIDAIALVGATGLWPTFADRALWVLTDPDEGGIFDCSCVLARIDVASRRVTDTIPVASGAGVSINFYMGGHGTAIFADGALWLTVVESELDSSGADLGVEEGRLVRIEPETRQVTDRITIPVPTFGAPSEGFDALWIPTREGLVRVDLATRQVTGLAEVSLGIDSSAAAIAAGDGMWIGHPAGVSRIDPVTAEVTDTVAGPVPQDVSGAPLVTDDALWAWNPEGVVRIDPNTKAVTDAIELQTAPEFGRWHPVEAGGYIWAQDGDGVVRVDPVTRGVTHRLDLPAHGRWSVAVAHDSLWVANALGVSRVDLDVPQVIYTLRLRGSSLLVDRADLWVHSYVSDFEGKLVRIIP